MLNKDYYSYLKTTYASFLGKCIGVRLGAPVENWTSEKIKETYGLKKGYLVDYGVFAADDDTNGPLFFIRPLLEKDSIDEKDIGQAFLDYICEYHGFFWWGGVGVSSEHTAYENLKQGLIAPKSGSYKTNGNTIAEQIGGQIFSDCWGYVSGFKPEQAKNLAAMASSVSHDLNGIQGGIFVAVCISLAYEIKDIHTLLNEAIKYLDCDMDYYKAVVDIMNFYNTNKDNYLDCLEYIQDKYSYDKYDGVCHIIPNTCLMIMAMCYGDNDFSNTLEILNRSGWDSDCNCGNVGSILGALVGIEGIDEKWITPINDVVNCSSCVGYLNIQYISEAAKMYTRLAYKLDGKDIEEMPLFNLDYAYKGIYCNDGYIKVKDNSLYVDSKDIFKYTYYLAKDLFDARYDPEFSPLIYPNDEIIIEINSKQSQNINLYCIDCKGNKYTSNSKLIKGNDHISMLIPTKTNMVINKIGINSEKPYSIINYKINRKPIVEYQFSNYPIDHYGPRYEGDYMDNIRGFVKHSGDWSIDEEGLKGVSKESALISSGSYGSNYKEIEWSFNPIQGYDHKLVFNMKDYGHFMAIGFCETGIELVKKDEKLEVINRWNINLKYEKTLLKLCSIDDKIIMLLKGKQYPISNTVVLHDLYGIYLGKDTINLSIGLKIS